MNVPDGPPAAGTIPVREIDGAENRVRDAVGPEVFSFADLVRTIRDALGARTPVLPMPGPLVHLAGFLAGRFLGDVVLTRAEIRGLAAGLLVSRGPPTCPTRLTEWLADHAEELGRRYASELARHWRPDSAT